MQFRDYRGVHQMLCETVDKHATQGAYRWFDEKGVPDSVTWAEFYQEVKAAAKSLMALGVKTGDKVNILSYTSYRWVLTDMANMSIGAATVGIYQSNLPRIVAILLSIAMLCWCLLKMKNSWQSSWKSEQIFPMSER